MKTLDHRLNRRQALALAAGLLCLPVRGADSPAKTTRPPIYDEQADGAQQIADTLARAKKRRQRVLLTLGANWCPWCHKLNQLFETDAPIGARLNKSYVLVLVDVNQEHNAAINQRYGNPRRHGIPVILVLDDAGRLLATQDTGSLEQGDHHDPKKVLAFLDQWAGQAAPATSPRQAGAK
jgi:thiol:disulfide interchange protein